MAYTIIGQRGTGNITSDQPIRDVYSKIDIIQLMGDRMNEAPLTVLLDQLHKSREVKNFKYECFEEDIRARSGIVSGSHDITTTTLTLTTGTQLYLQIRPGTLLYVPSTGERLLVTAVQPAAHTATVIRNVEGADGGFASGTEGRAAVAIASGAEIKLAGDASAQGTSFPDAISTNPSSSYNLTQVFKHTAELSGTLQNTDLYGEPNTLEHRTRLALIDHKVEIENAFWFGVRSTRTDPVTGKPMNFTGGILEHIQSNLDLITDGLINMKVLDGFMELLAENKPGGLFYLFGGLRFSSCLDAIPRYAVRVDDKATSFGTNMKEVTTNKGTFRFVLNTKVFCGDLAATCVALDMDKVEKAHLQNRDTTLYPRVRNVEVHGDDYTVNLVQSEVGLFMRGYGLDNPLAATTGAARSTHGILYTTDSSGFSY